MCDLPHAPGESASCAIDTRNELRSRVLIAEGRGMRESKGSGREARAVSSLAVGQCTDGPTNTKDRLDSRSVVYYLPLTLSLGQRFL
jgi:hypothetical protein